MSRTARMLAASIVCGGLFAQSPVDAADDSRTKRAETLYDEAMGLAERGNYTSACPKLEESQRLDPALGTQFNLADCYEHVGRLGSALQLFVGVLDAARAAGKEKLTSRAHDRVRTLDGRVGRIRILLSAVDADAIVKLDGAIVNQGLRDPGIPVDAGRRVIDVTAARKAPWTGRVNVADGEVVQVTVPALASARAPVADAAPPPKSNTLRNTGLVLAGLGVVGLGVGTAFGIAALSKRDEAREKCRSDEPTDCRDAGGLAFWDEAVTAGNVSTVSFVAGGVLVAAGAVLFVVAPSTGRRAFVAPSGGASHAGAIVGGSF